LYGGEKIVHFFFEQKKPPNCPKCRLQIEDKKVKFLMAKICGLYNTVT